MQFADIQNSVYASCCVFVMFKEIKNPAACEMRSVIRFLNAKNMKPAEIHGQLCISRKVDKRSSPERETHS